MIAASKLTFQFLKNTRQSVLNLLSFLCTSETTCCKQRHGGSAKLCSYTRVSLCRLPRNLQDGAWSPISPSKLNWMARRDFNPHPRIRTPQDACNYTTSHFSAIIGLAPIASRLQCRTLLLELNRILKLKYQRSLPLIRIAGSTVKPLWVSCLWQVT
jgi:hypothetical protein